MADTTTARPDASTRHPMSQKFVCVTCLISGSARNTRSASLASAAGSSGVMVPVKTCASAGSFLVAADAAPDDVAIAFSAEVASGRLFDDAVASLYRVAWGFVTAVIAAPAGH